jgi:Animal haem peroxidase
LSQVQFFCRIALDEKRRICDINATGIKVRLNRGALGMTFGFRLLAAAFVFLLSRALLAEDRKIDGTFNNLVSTNQGAANQPMIRFRYHPQFANANGDMLTDVQRANARDVSNAISAQSASRPNTRGLSNYIWAWGQFLTHDTALTTTSDGPVVNGIAPIAVNGPTDPLGPNSIPFTRGNFRDPGRIPINEVTSYIDASQIYGSDPVRAAALRTSGGSGAKLVTSANNLLPYNTAGLPNENNGPVPDNQLFLAGDIRANENSLLTSLHTVFAREHNRLVDIVSAQQPSLSEEQQYQLARKIVGAEMQAITYREFLPALIGTGSSDLKVERYSYIPGAPADITTAWSHAAFRFGHSAVTSELNLVGSDGVASGSLSLRNVFFNPNLLTNEPGVVDQLLSGAAAQTSEEIDLLVVDDLRNFLFGPPGAGGLDLAALNIQRGRDAGVPNYRVVRNIYGRFAPQVDDISDISSDSTIVQALSALYAGDIENVDAWVGGLAEDHVAGASLGPLIKGVLESQFKRLRDGDRLFYRGNAAGLYTNGMLNPEIAAIIDLDNVTLADIILANTSIERLQENVFFVPIEGDFDGDGAVDAADYVVWRKYEGTSNAWADGDGDGVVGPEDYAIWRTNFGRLAATGGGAANPVPEPAMLWLLFAALVAPSISFFRFVRPIARYPFPE